ncbi:alpha/beta hydrolase [Microbispora sp. NBC_01189]|uniref:alpha/beta hydrolase n=1 Tax=Microbispora sp. NBC_01189 TaxID=2903583 RepID=UPI002E0EAB02|nr:alpha/beta hydrolase [Microbispora sp. NBC_01189]
MKRVVGVVAGVAALVAGLAVPGGAAASGGAASGGAAAQGRAPWSAASWSGTSPWHPAMSRRRPWGPPQRPLEWRPCPAEGSSQDVSQGDTSSGGLPGSAVPRRTRQEPTKECATLDVPLDYSEPYGQRISLALNRIRGTVSRDANHLGVLLVNPGGPGGEGLSLAGYVAARLPADVAARFDVVGFAPRGVAPSRPALSCADPARFFAAPRPDNVPRGDADEQVLAGRAQQYAEGCGNRWAWFLPYLTSENNARDMDAIRAALGEDKISYLGYSYGTYLGAVYATLFPRRVRRLVLDSVVDPEGVWYGANIAQDRSFDRRHRDLLAWLAAHDDVYRLGASEAAVSYAWYAMRARLRDRPAGGLVGPSELDDVFSNGAYTDRLWPYLGAAFSAYVHRGDPSILVRLFHSEAEIDAEKENAYAVYLGVECRDAPWPRSWARWHDDTRRLHAEAPFMAWPNAVYNAPCAFWPEKGGTPVKVAGTAQLPPILLIQAQRDAATPYDGALRMRRRFPTARLVTSGGGNHGVSLAGNACVDRYLAAYLRDASAPPQRRGARGAGASCPADPPPRAAPVAVAPAAVAPANGAAAPGAAAHESAVRR